MHTVNKTLLDWVILKQTLMQVHLVQSDSLSVFDKGEAGLLYVQSILALICI